MFVHTVIMVIEPHMKQGRQHKLISTIFLATSVTKKLDHNSASVFCSFSFSWAMPSASTRISSSHKHASSGCTLVSLFVIWSPLDVFWFSSKKSRDWIFLLFFMEMILWQRFFSIPRCFASSSTVGVLPNSRFMSSHADSIIPNCL